MYMYMYLVCLVREIETKNANSKGVRKAYMLFVYELLDIL